MSPLKEHRLDPAFRCAVIRNTRLAFVDAEFESAFLKHAFCEVTFGFYKGTVPGAAPPPFPRRPGPLRMPKSIRSESCRMIGPRIFRIFVPNFAPNFALNCPRIFWWVFVLRFVGNGDQKSFNKNPWRFSMQNSQASLKKKSTKVFWRAGRVKKHFKRNVLGTTPEAHLGEDHVKWPSGCAEAPYHGPLPLT